MSKSLIPVTDNKTTIYYETDAPYHIIHLEFMEAESTKDLIIGLQEKGYKFTRFVPTMTLNFDE